MEIEAALDPDGGSHGLTFSRYTVDGFRRGQHDTDTDAQAASTIGLIRSGLLKRFESSAFAFVRTLNVLIHGREISLKSTQERPRRDHALLAGNPDARRNNA
jgi:hypothetical protein